MKQIVVLLLLLFQQSNQQNPCTTNEGQPGRCSLLVQCTTFFAHLAQLSRSPCEINPQQQGVCCPIYKFSPIDPSTMVQVPPTQVFPLPQVTSQLLDEICLECLQKQRQKENFENQLVSAGVVPEKESLVRQHARLFVSTDEVLQKGRGGELMVEAAINLAERLQMSGQAIAPSLSQFSMAQTRLGSVCPVPPACQRSLYRNIDGSCNNIANPMWGQAEVSFRRLLPPVYQDGLNTPRSSVTGRTLPSARALSVAALISTPNPNEDFTLLVMQWGQFLDHDLTHTPINKGSNGSVISCCNEGQVRPQSQLHPECLPIDIAANDAFFARFGQRCMDFVRSLASVDEDCRLGARQQMNQITSYIDASNVYGSSDEEVRNLREFRGGLLKTVLSSSRHQLLPPTFTDEQCERPRPEMNCFAAGDTRVNEQPNLTVLHTVWLRQHNKLAQELASINPHWDDERLFQETRRIVGAQMQHITYNEFLPIVLGREFVDSFNLVPLKEGYSRSYDSTADATVSNAFATAAFRFGHTLIDSTVQGYSMFGTTEINRRLRNVQFSPFFLYENNAVESLIRGLTIQPSQKFDNSFTEDITNHLFADDNSFGMDLVALNLQRGRDHGLPPYTQWRSFCQRRPVRSFEELADVMSPQAISYLTGIYESVDDIDLFLGGILETPIPGALVGHTFRCIIGEQFYKLKAGDRFFYENGGHHMSFSLPQLQQIRSTSLARVLCDASEGVTAIQPLAFLQARLTNKRIPCESNTIPSMDLSAWRENI